MKDTILEMKGVHKSFGASAALQNVNFQLSEKEIHGLLGGNGAGKTTLMNVLFGLYKKDEGEIRFHDNYIDIQSPKDAINYGIGMVHQHFLQINNFSVIENIVLGTDIKNKYTFNLEEEEKKINDLAEKFGLKVDLNAMIEDLSMGVRQKVEILKTIYRGVEVLILDEPTTNLTPQEVDDLFVTLRVMVEAGMSIVFITHKLNEVLSVCDRITVLRNGSNVLTLSRNEASEEAFVRAMVGDEMNIEESVVFAEKGLDTGSFDKNSNIAFKIENTNLIDENNIPVLKNINLSLFENEIHGIAGVAANGQVELAEVIVGVQSVTDGNIILNGDDITDTSTRELFDMGVAYIPEDRLHDGFLPGASVAHNLILGFQRKQPYSKNNIMDWNTISQESWKSIKEFNIKTQGPKEIGANLSGGNIQRVMLARAFSSPYKLLIAHNPTRGLDIPSMDFVYSKLLERKKDGATTLLISENLDELLLICDRISVLYKGELVGTLDRSNFEKYEIGRMMSGVRTAN